MNDLTGNISTYRYRIFVLVFMATTINYFDRSIVGVMALAFQKLFPPSQPEVPIRTFSLSK